MVDRTRPDDARAVFAAALPDEGERRVFLRLFADAVRTAHAEGSRTWSVTLKRRLVRLNVGRLVAIDAWAPPNGPEAGGRRRAGYLLLAVPELDDATARALRQVGEDGGSPAGHEDLRWWRSVPATWIAAHADALRRPLLAAVRAVAARTSVCGVARAWSPGVIEHLRRELDLDVPFADHPDPDAGVGGGPDGDGEDELLEAEDLVPDFAEWFGASGDGPRVLAACDELRGRLQAAWSPLADRPAADPAFAGALFEGVVGPSAAAAVPSLTDVRSAFAGAGLAAADDWPGTASLVAELLRAAGRDAAAFEHAASVFARDPRSAGFDACILGPAVAAAHAEPGPAVTPATADAFLALTGEPLDPSVEGLPGTLASLREMATSLAAAFREEPALADHAPHLVFEVFCHWVARVRPLDHEHPPGIQYWKIAPDAQAARWDECREGGYICVGWPAIGNLWLLGDDPVHRAHRAYPKMASGRCHDLKRFARIPVGSYVVANRGTRAVLGIGRVVGPYVHAPDQDAEFPNRLPVEWIDTTPRRIHEKRWFTTFDRLDAEHFERILSAPELGGGDRAPAFTRRTFELLEVIRREPTVETVKQHKDELARFVKRPLRRILDELAESMPPSLEALVETRSRTLSRFPKNDFGQGGAYPFLWGAFYPRDRKRTAGVQLFAAARPDGFEAGFSARSAESERRDRLRDRLRERKDELAAWLAARLPDRPLVQHARDEEARGPALAPSELAGWLADPPADPVLRIDVPEDEVVGMPAPELVDLTEKVFLAFAPFMLLAIADDPEPALARLRRELDGDDPTPPPPDPPVPDVTPYTLDDAAGDLFMDRGEIERLVGLVRRRRNVILQGAPGTGKTYAARRLAQVVAGRAGSDEVVMVQFHPSYSYEDFVQGFRPAAEAGRFELRDGVFHRFCSLARRRPERHFVFIIDEINRGNLARILGELMVLIEADKRGPEHAMPLAYARPNDPPFHVPANVHLIGLMNTADRSLAVVDYALRRRFAFTTLAPAFGSTRFAEHLAAAGCPEAMVERVVTRLEALNAAIRESRMLGEGFEVGHSFFTVPPGRRVEDWDRWWDDILVHEIAPLLAEYCFDQPAEARRLTAIVRDGDGSVA